MEKEKRIYSLNLIAFLHYRLDFKDYELRIDEVDESKVYAVFPEMASVSIAISEYRNKMIQCYLHEFLNAYSDLRRRIALIKRERKD